MSLSMRPSLRLSRRACGGTSLDTHQPYLRSRSPLPETLLSLSRWHRSSRPSLTSSCSGAWGLSASRQLLAPSRRKVAATLTIRQDKATGAKSRALRLASSCPLFFQRPRTSSLHFRRRTPSPSGSLAASSPTRTLLRIALLDSQCRCWACLRRTLPLKIIRLSSSRKALVI